MFGLTPCDEGEILLRGEADAVIGSPAEAIALKHRLLPEDRRQHGVVLEMPIAANTSLANLDAVSRQRADRRCAGARSGAWATWSGCASRRRSIYTETGSLSGGNQQKVALARWLAIKPEVMILDEPTQGVDIGSKSEIHQIMVDLAEQGMAIVMISSELPEILGMSDRIAVMHGGTIAGVLSRAEATQEKILALALGTELLMLERHRREISLIVAILAIGAVLAVVAPGFFTLANLRDLLLANMPVLIVALGMTLVILTGQIDISVGSQFRDLQRGRRRVRADGAADAAGRRGGLPGGRAAGRHQRRAGGMGADSLDRGDAGDDGGAARRLALGDAGRLGAGSAAGLPVVRAIAGGERADHRGLRGGAGGRHELGAAQSGGGTRRCTPRGRARMRRGWRESIRRLRGLLRCSC